MDLLKLKSLGLVSSNPLLKEDIELEYYPLTPEAEWETPGIPERAEEITKGTVTVYLRRYTAADVIALSGVKGGEDRAIVAIQRCTFTEEGERLFPTLEDVHGLDLVMFSPLIQRINALNGGGKKKSLKKTNSGVSSHSRSGAAASRSGKTPSTSTNSKRGDSTVKSSAP